MTTYQLNFNIDTAGVTAINRTNQFITIVKSVIGPSGKTPVAWLTFQAAQMIAVTWEESYWLYATNSQFQAGTPIIEDAITASAAQSGLLYTFDPNNVFGTPVPGQPAGTFNVNNQVGNEGWQFGLAQMATVNGASTPQPVPLNIVPALNNETVSFTPEVTVSIFLQSFSNNGVVISEVASTALTVTLTSAASTASIGFSDTSDTFFRSDGDAARTAKAQMSQGRALAAR